MVDTRKAVVEKNEDRKGGRESKLKSGIKNAFERTKGLERG